MFTVASDPHKRKTLQHLQHLRDGRKEEAEFDEWWDKLTKAEQAELRQLDPPIIPYREMPLPRYSFPVYANDSKFASADPRKSTEQVESDGWVTRERVQEIVADILTLIGSSSDKSVQHHFDIIRIVMQTTDAPTQVDLAARMGLTKQAVCVRVQKMAARAALLSPGIISRMKFADQSAAPATISAEKMKNNNKIFKKSAGQGGGIRNLFPTPPFRRGASTTAKKHRNLKAAEQEGIQGADL
jgi:hypothetical protein